MSSVRQVLIKVVNSHFSSFVFLHFRSKLLILKSNCEQFALFVSCRSLKKIDMSDSLLICVLSTSSNSLQKIHIFVCFWPFFPVVPLFYAQEWIAPIILCSVALFKERWERFTLFPERISFSLFCSQKRAICSKNRRANSQPWY